MASVVAIFSAVFFIAFVSQAQTQAGSPNTTVVQSEIQHRNNFSFILGGIAPKGDRAHKLTRDPKGNIYEWSKPTETVVAQFGRATDITGEVWRLSEIEVSKEVGSQKETFSGVTTTFYKHGVRSKTKCSGPPAETAQCVTASRKFCETFKARNKPLGIRITDEGTKENILRMGRECSDYADYLNLTLDPNKILNGSERSDRDENVVKADLAALREFKGSATTDAVRKLKLDGFDDWFGSDDKVGASTTGMKNRGDRLKQAGTDFKVLSELAAMCAETTFVEQSPGAGWTLEKPRSKAPTRQ